MAKTGRVKSDAGPMPPEDDSATKSAGAGPTVEEIAVRAYYIYLERGGAEGNPSDDWLQAERELTEGQ